MQADTYDERQSYKKSEDTNRRTFGDELFESLTDRFWILSFRKPQTKIEILAVISMDAGKCQSEIFYLLKYWVRYVEAVAISSGSTKWRRSQNVQNRSHARLIVVRKCHRRVLNV